MHLKQIIIAILLLGLQGTGAAAQELQKVRFMPHWLPQAQFAGYYIAEEKGIYEKHGLDVEVLMGGPNFPAIPVLTQDKTDLVSMFLSGAIKARARGIELVDVGQLSQRSALMFVAKKESGITRPEDFQNKKIGIWRSDFRELPLAFLKKYGIQAEIVPITSTVNLFLRGGVDIMCVMWYNEYHQILNFGLNPDEINSFQFYDYGLNYPEDGIFCLESFYEENPEACRKFTEATIEGWRYAFEHPEEALDVTLRHMEEAKVPANRAHQRWMLNRMRDVFILEDRIFNGQLHQEDYLNTARVLLESGTIDQIPDFDSFNKTPGKDEK